MSKYVKELISGDLKNRLQGVQDALLVSVIGMTANANSDLRKALRAKNIKLMVVKNSLARRAAEGTPLAPAFQSVEGTLAVVWGAEDIISLAKEVTRMAEDKAFAGFAPRGGVMDGAPLSAADVGLVSKWPSRVEQLSILSGQLLAPGAKLASQLLAPGGLLVSQLDKKADEGDAAAAPAEGEV